MKKIAYSAIFIITLLIILMLSGCKLNEIRVPTNEELQEMGVPTPQELKELTENLPPYSEERDCGFEALNVFEKFGGNIIFAQQGFEEDDFYDGIYSVEKTTLPSDLSELVGPGIFFWWGATYIYYDGFGCYELSLIERLDIIEHRGVNMAKNGPHVWNIINGIVIDISWARQNMRTFNNTVIVNNYIWNYY